MNIKIQGTDQTVEIPDEPHSPETEQQVFENLVQHRRRAASMSAESRRQAIIAATVPLLSEHGSTVTTSQIARAAGIAEGTIFRVFPDKRELVLAALRTAMSGDAEAARIAEIPADLPLAERLVLGLKAIEEYQQRFWALMRVFRETGWMPDPDRAGSLGTEAEPESTPQHPMARISQALAVLIQPNADSLRLDGRAAARLLLSLAISNCMAGRGPGESPSTPEQLVDLFLHGALGPGER